MLENKIGEFSLGPIKTFRGHEGETCMQGTILRSGKKVGEWSEDGWGGPHRIDFNNTADEKAFKAAANVHPTAVEFAAEMAVKYGKQDDNDHADLVLSSIAQDIEQQAQFKRWCKTKIVIKEVGAAEGEFTTYKRLYDPETDDKWIFERHPGCEIINKSFGITFSKKDQENEVKKQFDAKLRRLCKTKIVLKEPGDTYRSYNRAYDAAKDDAWLAVKHPNAEIVNKRFP